MARKEAFFTVKDEGRDKGKVYKLTEMSATQSEEWSVRAFLALANNGVDVPGDVRDLGMAGLAQLGIAGLAKLRPEDAIPIMNELMGCVQAVPDPGNQSFVRALVESDIEEVKTRLVLKYEVLKLHFDFFAAVGPLISARASAAPTSEG